MPCMKYKTKPRIKEAVQWVPGELAPPMVRDASLVSGFVTTIHGQRTLVVPGDFIVTEPGGGEFYYPCKPDIFLEYHDPVTA